MCDYSLMEFPNRLARDGEELITHRFHTGTIGLTPLKDLQPAAVPRLGTFWRTMKDLFEGPKSKRECAVCIPPGALLLLRQIPESLQCELSINSTERATFTQVSAQTYSHRDAVTLSNGRTLLLQRLHEGQRMKVLSLSSGDAVEPPAERFELEASAVLE